MTSNPKTNTELEQRSATASKWANLFMGVAGVLAAWLSHSEAILLDGLYSAVGFLSAIFAGRVAQSINRASDESRPFGYDADESLYTMLRAMSLLGLISFAAFTGIMRIIDYLSGGEVPELVFGPIVIYFAVVCGTCALLWSFHYYNWRRTGQQSDILKVEAGAAMVDGAITGAAGLGLIGASQLVGTPLAAIIPISDSLVLLVLCVLIVFNPYHSFRQGLRELAGIGLPPEGIDRLRDRVLASVVADEFDLIDLRAMKLGRTTTIAVHIDPKTPIDATAVDRLTERLKQDIAAATGRSRVYLLVTKHDRRQRHE